MRITKRVYGVVLAGLLAASMGAAPLAMAETGLLQGLAGGGDADEGQAVEAVAMADASVPSYTTVVLGPISFQVLDGWTFTDGSSNGVSDYMYEDGENGMFEVLVSEGESYVGSEDAFQDEYVSYLSGQIPNMSCDEPEDRYLDGTLIRDIAYTASQDGTEYRGILTLVYGDDYTVIVSSAFTYDETADTSAQYIQAHRSVAPVATGSAATVEPATAGDAGEAAVADTSSLPTNGTIEAGVEFALVSGWTVTVNPDASTYQWVTAPEDFFLDEYQGAEMVAVSCTVTNTTAEALDPFDIMVYTYNSNDEQQADWPGIGFDDSIEEIGTVEPGQSVTCYLYAAYTGDGTYGFEFSESGLHPTVYVEIVK